MSRTEVARRQRVRRLGVEVTLGTAVLAIVLPVVWLALVAFMPGKAIISSGWHFTFWLGNYRAVFNGGTFVHQIRNSAEIVAGTVVICLAVGSLGGHAIARLGPPKWLLVPTLVLAALIPMVPPATLVPGFYVLMHDLGLLGSVAALILLNSLFNLPFATLLLSSYFRGIPTELGEAARVDGAGELRTFVQVMLPLVKPGMAATGVFVGIMAWNEFLMGLTMTSGGSTAPVTVGIAGFVQQYSVTWGELAAAGTVAAIPMILLAIFASRSIVAGLTAGAVKG